MSDAGSPPAAPAAEAKPKPEADPNTLNIKLVATDGSEVFFKIKKTTRLNKLKTAYAERIGVDASTIRLLFDGQNILDTQTATELDLEDNDVLEVMLEQVGGHYFL